MDNTEANIASDDPAVESTPRNIGAGKDIARRQYKTQSWSWADLTGILAGDDPARRVADRVAPYWERQFQRTLVNTLTGVFADNDANDSGDMINDIGTDAGGAPAATELVSAEAILDTKQTMGDAGEALSTIIMHSVVRTRLDKLNLIDFIPDSQGVIKYPTYLGYRVIVDDSVRAVTGANRTKYWTYLCGPNLLGWAEVPAKNAVATDRDEQKGNGAGIETLYTRRQFVMHPYGIKFTDSSVAGEFPTHAELAAAGNWDRVYAERKQIPLAALVTNG